MNQPLFNPEEFEAEAEGLTSELRQTACFRPYHLCIEHESGKLEVFLCNKPEHWTVDEIANAERLFQYNLSLLDYFMSDPITCDYDLGICDDELVFFETDEENSNALSIGERLFFARAELSGALARLKSLRWKLENDDSWKEDGF